MSKTRFVAFATQKGGIRNLFFLWDKNLSHSQSLIKNTYFPLQKDKVLETMKQAGEPLNAGKIAELSGLDRKEVDKAMKQLKEEGAIVSPVRCKWEPAK